MAESKIGMTGSVTSPSKETRIFLLKNRSLSGRRPPRALSHNLPRFRRLVWAYYRKHGRHDLPWRQTKDVYKILVSEVMLQQTQVERVIPFYKKFIKQFPTAKKLAQASLSAVLKSWQGLGYNRRAKMLRQAAMGIERSDLKNLGQRSDLVVWLESLSGVGPYTANAIRAFALNQDVIVIETNIRTAIIHHFFSDKIGQHLVLAKKVSDSEIEKILEQTLPKGRAREWYSALMDYGTHLKQSGISHNARSKTYTKQSKFTGSLREARGTILRTLSSGKKYQGLTLINLLGSSRRVQLRAALAALESEGLISKSGRAYTLAR
jgi:A/G-specific adenine glycosylase